jgi:glycosyltransferase involved in cell wall biosynthesis
VRTFVRLYREFRRLQPHIVHTHMAKAGLVGRLAAAAYNLTRRRRDRAHVIHTYHGHVLDGYFSAAATRVFITLERLLARVSDRLVAIAPAIRAELQDKYRIGQAAQYRVVPLGFDLSPFAAVNSATRLAARRALNIAPDAPVIVTVGRLTAIKQPRLFLEVVQRVAQRHPRTIALIAGDGELRGEVEASLAELGIADRVRLLGWRRDLATIYAAADIFLLTSRNEGTPVALIEAMASGTVGVSTDVGGVMDVMGGPDTGRTAPLGDVTGLANAINELIEDAALREAMGARARARVLERYDLTRLVGDIAALYRELEAAR